MMKTRKIFFILTVAFFALQGCYEDKGNYDYTEIAEIDIDSIGGPYERLTLVDSLHIIPEITPDNKQYDCFWGVYPAEAGGFAPKLDTICHTRELHYRVELEPGKYVLVFAAKDKETEITRFTTTSLNVETALTSGWYVLSSNNGYTDIDVFTERGKAEGILSGANNGVKLKGEARSLTFQSDYSVWDEEKSKYVGTICMFALASEDAVVFRVSNAVIVHDFQNLFFEVPEVIAPLDCKGSRRELYFINAGRMYTISNLAANSGHFGGVKLGNYDLSPYWVSFGARNPLLFDKATASFCSVDVSGSELLPIQNAGPVDSIKLIPVNHMDADLLFMGARGRYRAGAAWALMKKKNEELYMMIKMNADIYTPYKNPVQLCDTLDNTLKILSADYRATNLDNDIIYFAKDETIYSCNINADYAERKQFSLEAGERVTWMRHLKGEYVISNVNYMVIATCKDNKYKIYLCEIQAGNLKKDLSPKEGEGEVRSVICIKGSESTPIY